MEGFAKIRRGLLTHLREGRLTWMEYSVYVTIIMLADCRTGVWFGSTDALVGLAGAGDLSKRWTREIVHRLEAKGYLKRFRTQGQRGNHPYLVNFFEVTDGSLKGKRIDAAATTDYKRPVCVDVSEDVGVNVAVDVGVNVGVNVPLSRSKNRELRTTSPTLTASRTDLPAAAEPVHNDESSAAADSGAAAQQKPVTSKPSKLPDTPAAKLATHFFTLLGKPKKHVHSAAAWETMCRELLLKYAFEEIRDAMTWAVEDEQFWVGVIFGSSDPLQKFCARADTILQQHAGHVAKLAVIDKKLAKATQSKSGKVKPTAAVEKWFKPVEL